MAAEVEEAGASSARCYLAVEKENTMAGSPKVTATHNLIVGTDLVQVGRHHLNDDEM